MGIIYYLFIYGVVIIGYEISEKVCIRRRDFLFYFLLYENEFEVD